jgi:hypothetical protein
MRIWGQRSLIAGAQLCGSSEWVGWDGRAEILLTILYRTLLGSEFLFILSRMKRALGMER